jgi:hypothetical protein
MIRAMVWKEWREQRTVALAVLSFGSLALCLTALLADEGARSSDMGGPRELMPVALAYLAGAVSGAILLADEKEVGTLEFLDSLPCRRLTVWVGKGVAGGLLTILQCVLIGLLAISLETTDSRFGPLAYGLGVVLVGLLSFAWGTLGGALARSTLGAVFQGSLFSFAGGFVLAVPFLLVFGQQAFTRLIGVPVILFYACWVATGLLGSAALFTRLDRQRGRRRLTRSPTTIRRKAPLASLRAVIWLTSRQAVFVTLGAGALGLMVGVSVLVPDAPPSLFVWPSATLVLGVLAGVTTVGEEQVRGVARFWAERRLPLGRFWLIKAGFHFAVAAAASLILLLFIYTSSHTYLFRSRLTVELRPELARFLALGLVYGFVVGHLAGMVFRKTVVAGLVALVVAATLAGLIMPSVIGGGVAAWQVWGPAAVLLLTARVTLYPWATQQVAARGPLARVLGGVFGALFVVVAGIGYRVVEVPSAPDRMADAGYEQSLPTSDANETGRRVKAAAARFRTAALEAREDFPGPRQPAGPARRAGPPPENPDPLLRAIRDGWTPENSMLLDRWLNQVFAADWPRVLEEVADDPPGVYEDPRDLDFFSPPDSFQNLRDMSIALRVRGMQRQAAGDPDVFPALLRAGLAAARTARNRGGFQSVEIAHECERWLLFGIPYWLAHLDGRPDLLRTVLAELGRHETEMPVGAKDAFWAEQVMLRNTMDRLGSWLPRVLDPKSDRMDGPDSRADAESNVMAFAWHIPWERLRRERLLRLETVRPVDPKLLSGLHVPIKWRLTFERTKDVADEDLKAMALRRFSRVRVAVRFYELDHRAMPLDLPALAPRYLPTVPVDPYTGRPFGYRISVGEDYSAGSVFVSREDYLAYGVAASLGNPVGGLSGLWIIGRLADPESGRMALMLNPPVNINRYVPPGYGIVWSAGPDGQDNGGRRTGPRGYPANPGDDWIMVLPPGRQTKD